MARSRRGLGLADRPGGPDGLAMAFQGPGRAIGQLLDVPGHARLLGAAIERVRRSGRLLAVAVGVSVVAWTVNQTFSYSVPTGRDDLMLLTKGRRLVNVALNQGELAAMTPLRDVVGLGLVIPLLIGAAVVLFQFSTDRWGSGVRPAWSVRRRTSRWATIGWGGTALYALYRFVGLVTGNGEVPMGGCIIVEAAVVPLMMVLADAVLVAWVLVELRNAGLGDQEGETLDVIGVSLVVPAAARGASWRSRPGTWRRRSGWSWPTTCRRACRPIPGVAYLRWQPAGGWSTSRRRRWRPSGCSGRWPGAGGRPATPWGAIPDARGPRGGTWSPRWRRAGWPRGASRRLAYLLVLSLPASTWELAAADSYAHYGTLPVGLILLAALVELGERSLPMAAPARAGAMLPPAPRSPECRRGGAPGGGPVR